MRDTVEGRLRSRVHSPVERAPKVRTEPDGGAPTSSLVRHMTILAVANSLVVMLLCGLSATPHPSDRVLYVAFSPLDDPRDIKARIVAAGGRAVEGDRGSSGAALLKIVELLIAAHRVAKGEYNGEATTALVASAMFHVGEKLKAAAYDESAGA